MEQSKKEILIPNNNEIIDYEEPEGSELKTIDDKKKTRKTLISCHKKFLINPSITKFNERSRFIYDLDEGERYINSIKNANGIKLNEIEIKSLKDIFLKINEEKNEAEGNKKIFIQKDLLNDINKYFIKPQNIDDNLTLFLKKEYIQNTKRKGFTSRKLSEKYFLNYGIKVSHVTVNNALKERLGLKYLKVKPKTNKILCEENVLRALTLIKIIARCFIQKLSIIYVDESSILNQNNNLRTWIQPKENLFCDIESKKRYNLIMGINEEGIIHYEIHKSNIDEDIFLKFIHNLKSEINKREIKYYTLFLDNLSVHKSNNAIKYFCENSINVIYNVPYLSYFNSIELCFRALKNIIYKQVYENMEKLENDIRNILNSQKFEKTIRYNFKETIFEYIKYYKKYKDFNLNKFKY
jgi:hypothetical protein